MHPAAPNAIRIRARCENTLKQFMGSSIMRENVTRKLHPIMAPMIEMAAYHTEMALIRVHVARIIIVPPVERVFQVS